MERKLLEKFVVSDTDEKTKRILEKLKELKYWGL
jgi:hypothetical protein